MNLAALLTALLFLYAPGHFALLLATRGRTRDDRRLPAEQFVLAAVTFSLLFTTSVAHALGGVGSFTPALLQIVVAGTSAIFAIAAIGRRAAWMPFRIGAPALVAAGVVAFLGWMFAPPSEFVGGSADEGIYFNAGVLLAKSGALWFEEPFLRSLYADLAGFQSSTYLNGFYFEDVEARTPIVSHGFHYLSSFVAVMHTIGGIRIALAAPIVLTLLGALGLFVMLARTAGPWVAALVTLLVGLNPASFFFARITFAETMSAGLLLAAAGLLVAGWPRADTGRAWSRVVLLLAGAALGSLHLIKIDFFPLPVVMLLAVFGLWMKGVPNATSLPLVVGYGASLVVSAGHWLTTHRVYFYGQFHDIAARLLRIDPREATPVDSAPLYVLALFVGFGLCVVVGAFSRRRIARLGRYRPLIRVGVLATGGIAAVALFVLWVMPTKDPAGYLAFDTWTRASQTVKNLALYVTLPGLLAGVLGVTAWARRDDATALLPVFLLFAALTSVAFAMAMTVDWGAQHFNWARRFFNITIPLLIAGAIVPCLRPGPHARWRAGAGLALAAWIGWNTIHTSKPFAERTPYTGLLAALESLRDQAPDNVLWLCSYRDQMARAYLVPLRCLFDQRTFVVLEHGHIESFTKLLTHMEDAGYDPTLLMGPWFDWQGERFHATGRVFFPHDDVSAEPFPYTPRRAILYQTASKVRVVERPLERYHTRLPDARDFPTWRYPMVVVRTW